MRWNKGKEGKKGSGVRWSGTRGVRWSETRGVEWKRKRVHEWPTAHVPIDPVPSIIAVTVASANGLPASDSCVPLRAVLGLAVWVWVSVGWEDEGKESKAKERKREERKAKESKGKVRK